MLVRWWYKSNILKVAAIFPRRPFLQKRVGVGEAIMSPNMAKLPLMRHIVVSNHIISHPNVGVECCPFYFEPSPGFWSNTTSDLSESKAVVCTQYLYLSPINVSCLVRSSTPISGKSSMFVLEMELFV